MNILENDCEEGRQFYGEPNSRNTFTCRVCGKAEYQNGEFETIKMGDIFTHITHFPSISTENSEQICSSCSRLNINPCSPSSRPECSSPSKLLLQNNCTTTIMQNLNHSNHSSNNIINNNNNNSRSSCGSNSNILQSATPSPPILHTHSPNPPGSNNSHQLHHFIISSSTQPMTTSPPTTTMYRDNNNSMQPMSTINQPQRIQCNSIISHTQSPTTHLKQSLTALTAVTNSTTEDTDVKYPMSFYTSHPPVISHSNGNGIGADNPSNTVVVKSEFLTESLPVVVPGAPPPSSHPANFETTDNSPPGGKDCRICNKTFKNSKIAQNHFNRVHEKLGKYVCEICGVVFSYRGSLDSHLASHNTSGLTHDCPTCGQKFKDKSNLNQHLKTHADIPKNFKCELCPSEFAKRVNLRYHIKRKHPEPAEGMNDANGSSTKNPSDAKTTDATKSPGKDQDKPQGNFKCEHCGRCFLFKNNLKAHLRTHTRDKKYTCEICTKSFIYKESLKNHMLLHSNTLPYLCEICGKKFRDRSNRRKHVKNVHKYMFINSDGTTTANPIVTTNGEISKNSKALAGEPSKPPAKRKRNSKKKEDAANINKLPDEKSRGIIKSTPKNRKSPKNSNNSNNTKTTNNKKSVIVSAASTLPDRDLDRKIIMSPKPTGAPGDFAHSHLLPLTVHVPLTGNSSPSQYNLSHGRNVIVKASSTISASNQSANLNPSLDLYQHQQRVSHQQNVIVYPKPKIMSDPQQQQQQQPYPPNSVISQNLQQPQYYNHNQQQQQEGGGGGYPPQGNYIPMPMSGLVSPPSSIPPQQQQPSRPSSSSAFEYVLSTNTSSERSNEITRYGPPHGSLGHNPPGEGPAVNNQYSLSTVYQDNVSYQQQQQQHEHPQHHPHHPQYWTTNVDSNPPTHRPTSSSPYTVAAPTSDTPVSVASFEGPITAASNVLNAPTYTVLHGQEVVDPSGNGTYFYKDLSQFDFSFL